MRCRLFSLAICALTVPSLTPLFAAALTTTVIQPNAATSHWNAPIWDPGPVSPTAGNTYEVLAGARIRSPNGTAASGGNDAPGQTFSFPGDSLQIDGIGFATAGTGEIRFKHTFDNTTFAFPGVGGNPGLILNGGMLNDGEERIPTIAGSVSTVVGTTSSINPGGQNVTDISFNRGFIFTATFTGSGALTLDYGHDFPAAAPAVQIESTNGSFTGDWTVNSGWLLGLGPDSLGFGDIMLTSIQGPSTLDVDYNLTNPSGSLILEGPFSKLILDQDLTFGSVTIDGTPLSVGVHSFAELNASFDANIVDGGTGNVIVVPEPSSFAMALLGALGFLRTTRRRA